MISWLKKKGCRFQTRVSSDDTALISNDLRQRIERLAALWLQLPVTDKHDLARIVTIAEAWTSLEEHAKRSIESLVDQEGSIVRSD